MPNSIEFLSDEIASLEIKAFAEGNLGLIIFCRVDILYFSYFGEDT